MAKVKRCLDTDCTKYYLLDDDRIVNVVKDVCEKRKKPRNVAEVREAFTSMVRNASKTLYMSEDPEWKEGEEAVI